MARRPGASWLQVVAGSVRSEASGREEMLAWQKSWTAETRVAAVWIGGKVHVATVWARGDRVAVGWVRIEDHGPREQVSGVSARVRLRARVEESVAKAAHLLGELACPERNSRDPRGKVRVAMPKGEAG